MPQRANTSGDHHKRHHACQHHHYQLDINTTTTNPPRHSRRNDDSPAPHPRDEQSRPTRTTNDRTWPATSQRSNDEENKKTGEMEKQVATQTDRVDYKPALAHSLQQTKSSHRGRDRPCPLNRSRNRSRSRRKPLFQMSDPGTAGALVHVRDQAVGIALGC